MKVQFKIQYNTSPGQSIYISGTSDILGNEDIDKAIKLHYRNHGIWTLTIDDPVDLDIFEYRYFMKDSHEQVTWEWGRRMLKLSAIQTSLALVTDTWRAPSNAEKVIYSSAFCNAILKPIADDVYTTQRTKQSIDFRIQVPRISQGYKLCILGNQPQLGGWDRTKPLLLSCGTNFPEWIGSIDASKCSGLINYKYGIYNTHTNTLETLETGTDRQLVVTPQKEAFQLIKTDESFRYPSGNWKGAGVSVPVFSLKSKNSFGVGDFSDLLDFVDWAKHVGMKMVQILPVNETVGFHSWLDSYPYKSISVMALHPIYLNLYKLGILKDDNLRKTFKTYQLEHNREPFLNYPEIHRLKSRYIKLIFDQQKSTFFEDDAFLSFFETNKNWLVPYAAFAYLRDKMQSPNFRTWKTHRQYNKVEIERLCSVNGKAWDDISIHYYIQFHLDKQLKEVTEFARHNGIVLKGDIPIGISPNSVEAWTEPHLFNLGVQAGAPPDDFAVKGQNWGFPTYNWEHMALEDYTWWKKRLHRMSVHFDAYRIDHILGFFRIWEIPIDAVEGILGYFNPALPLTAKEIEDYGIHFDQERMTQPYIRRHLIIQLFGDDADEVTSTFLQPTSSDVYTLKPEFSTQLKVNKYFLHRREEDDLSEKYRNIRDGLFALISNVLFIETGPNNYHPRISMNTSTTFKELNEDIRQPLLKIYNHYFYERHDDFWRGKGLEKLPAIISASKMLICGEDLGMIPKCVPSVMDQLAILSLEIQRMPKNPMVRFAHPMNAPYLSVCTTSTHDMSTIRGWWEEDRKATQLFYNNELGNNGEAPYFAEPWVCKQMIAQHLQSPAMWATFPIQDLIAMDGDLRWDNTQAEQINVPSDVRHKWKYRMHLTIEELKNAKQLNELLQSMVAESGRNTAY